MNDVEFKGDLYYVDPTGNSWKITQRPAERNPKQIYWHADQLRGGAHRVSASAYRLLIGIDSYVTGESVDDGPAKESDSEESASEADAERAGIGLFQFAGECLHPNHPEACQFPRDIENRRQAYLG